MPKVSVVVPIYKVEKYLSRSVKSLVEQTLKDIEIVLVDDGSPDKCPAICDALAETDARIKVVHKANGGLSSARNAGLAAATGDYVGFVDGDDDVEPDMFARMVEVAQREQVDFVMADYTRILSNGQNYAKTLDIDGGRYDRKLIREKIFPNLIMRECVDYGPLLSVWHCLYRTDFLKANRLWFDEEVRWSEDNIFSAFAGYYADSFYYMKGEALYHYYQNEGSITTSYRKGAWEVYSVMNRHLRDFFEEKTDYDFSRQLRLHMAYYTCSCIGMALTRSKQDAIADIRHIKQSEDWKKAFTGFKLPKQPKGLWMQLMLIKYGTPAMIYAIMYSHNQRK